jgi:SAM-dependent methyltransferase
VSPALAVLIGLGDVRHDDVVLDVGCGTGTECITLARWGFKHVVGIDVDARAVATARGRATRLGLARRVEFLVGEPEDLPDDLTPAGVDIVLHTLVANNLRAGFHSHFAAIARALKPDGLLVLSMRILAREENDRVGRVPPVPGLKRHFELTPGVTTHIAESRDYYPGHAPVAVWVGRPRAAVARGRR